jgi:hypothetical protein
VLLPSIRSVGRVSSTEGVKVVVKHTPKGLELEFPLAWTDIILLKTK